MSRKNIKSLENQQQSDDHYSNSKKSYKLGKSTSHKKFIFNKAYENNRHSSSRETSSVLTSLARLTDHIESNRHIKIQLASPQKLPQFVQKYTEKGTDIDEIYQQMLKGLKSKQTQVLTLTIYRDQLKFINNNINIRNQGQGHTNFRISLKLLQEKASLQSKIRRQKYQIKQELEQMQIENRNLREYTKMIIEHEQNNDNQILDINKQKEMMIDNMIIEIDHFKRELQQEKKKNNKEIKQLQDHILDLRIHIKEKQDKLREMKAKICTLYIKLNNRNSSRGRSQDRNLSMSVRKYNKESNQAITETFIGNHQFKTFSKQILQKVSSSQQLVKIKFFVGKQKLYFQCMYEKRHGLLHTHDVDYNRTQPQSQTTAAKSQQLSCQQIYTKYLTSMKFFYKSKIVGVQCRIKTDKGNRHVQIGNCQPHVEHQLVTLINRKLVTLGSYWHAKEMIGVSIWWIQANPNNNLKKNELSKRIQIKNKNVNSYDQYFT